MSDERKELLEALAVMYNRFCEKNPGDIQLVTEAYGKIRQIIQLHFDDDWQDVKKELGMFMEKQKLDVMFIKLLENAIKHGYGEKEFIERVLKKYKKPEIDDMKEYVEGKAEEVFNKLEELYNTVGYGLGTIEDFITQIISDVRGGKI